MIDRNMSEQVKNKTTANVIKQKEQRVTFIYIVECEDGSFYTGITTDVKRRMKEHYAQKEKGAKYTHSRRIKEIRMVWEAKSYSSAAKLEYAIKHLKRQDKERLMKAPGDVTKRFITKLASEEYFVKKEYCGLVSDFADIVK